MPENIFHVFMPDIFLRAAATKGTGPDTISFHLSTSKSVLLFSSTSCCENLLWYQYSLNCFYYFAESIVVLNFNIYFRSFDGCADDILMISCRLMSLQILIVSLSLLEILYAIKCFPKLTLAWMMKMSSIFKVL